MTETTTIATTTNSTPPAAVARKRRREILLSQRSSSACSSAQEQQQQQQQVSLESQKNVELAIPSISSCPTDAKRQKVDTTKTSDADPDINSNDGNGNKNSNANVASTRKTTSSKPKSQRKKANTQMRYDPDIPMTKEEAAAWRREARRVRNRESAAASRQKTRDRIVQLEGEVEEWKKKYEEVMAKLQQAESSSNGGGSPVERCRSFISPCSSPCRSPTLPNLPLCSSSLVSSDRGWDGSLKEKEPHLNEMISRPAVKITGAATSIPEPHPDSCVSAVTDVIPASIDLPATTGLVNEDGDLEDFLLDALEGLEQEKEMFSISN